MSVIDVSKHQAWGLLPLVGLVWHGIYTSVEFDLQYLLFICYPANALLAIGVLVRCAICVGIGSLWAISALPLFLHYAIACSDWAPSGFMFHFAGATVGALAVYYCRFPKHIWIWSLLFGASLQLTARLFTEPAYNINAAFSVYQGYGLFSNHLFYLVVAYVGFALSFGFLEFGNARLAGREA